MAFSLLDDALLTGGTDGRLRFWNTETFRGEGELDAGVSVTSLAVSPSGTRIVVGGRRRGCSVWSYPEGAFLERMPHHKRPVSTVDVAPSGLIVASGSYEGTVRLWEMDACREIDSFLNDRRRTAGAVFTPDGEYLVTNGFGGIVGVWTVPGFELLRAVHCHATAVFPPCFSPEGELMVTHGLEREMRVWNTDEWSFAGGLTLPRSGPLLAAYGPVASELIAASASTVWGIDPRRQSVEWITELEDIAVSSVAVSPSGEMAALGTEDGRVVLMS